MAQDKELSLNELYLLATGNVSLNVEALIDEIKDLGEDVQSDMISRILWTVPGGTGNVYKKQFIEALYAALNTAGVSVPGDVDADGDVDQDDYNKAKSEKLDVNGDEKHDEEDLELIKAMSTVKIVEEDGVADEPEDGEDVTENETVEDGTEESKDNV